MVSCGAGRSTLFLESIEWNGILEHGCCGHDARAQFTRDRHEFIIDDDRVATLPAKRDEDLAFQNSWLIKVPKPK